MSPFLTDELSPELSPELSSSQGEESFTLNCGCHGNQVTIATRYVANVYCPKEA